MFLCAVYELTALPREARDLMFASTLTKVFFTCLSTQFEAMVFAHWIQDLVDYSLKHNKEVQ